MSEEKKDSHQTQPLIGGMTGVILAGGRSSRFGKNKALVEIGGTRLIDRVVSKMESVFHRLVIISNTPQEYSYLKLPIFTDLIKGLGPVGGIYTGLEVIEDEMGFFVACDMPFINEKLIRYIVDVKEDFDAVVPKIDWMMEPLFALYRKSCLPTIKNMIESGIFQIHKAYQMIRVRYVNEKEIRKHDPELQSFLNINRPDELLDVMALGKKPLKK